jgi:hypothetical protein
MMKAKSERTNTTCSGLIPDSIITFVVDAFTPKRMAADTANRTPRVGCFWLN